MPLQAKANILTCGASLHQFVTDKTCWLTTGPKMVRKQADPDTKLKTRR